MQHHLEKSTIGLISSRPLQSVAIVTAALIGITLAGCSAGNLLDPKPTEDRPRIALSAASTSIGSEGGTLTAEVSNAGGGTLSWTASVDVTWASLQESSSGSGNATLTLSIEANQTTDERTATLTVRSTLASNSPQTLRFTQEAGEPEPDPTIEANVADFILDPEGETLEIDITVSDQTLRWELAGLAESWVRVLGRDSGTGNGTLTLEIDPNDGDGARSLTISLRLADTPEIVSELNFSQAEPPPVQLEVSADKTTFSADGGKAEISVSLTASSATWTAAVDNAPGWVQLNRSGDQLTVQVRENTGAERRSFVVTVTSQDAVNSPRTLQFTQDGADPPRITAQAANYNLGASGGAVNVQVEAPFGVRWTAQTSGGFAHILGSASGTGNGTLTLSVDRNDTEDQRSFDVTVTPDGGEAERLGFVQSGSASTASRIQLSAASYVLGAGGSTVSVSVSAGGNAEWSANVTGSFAHLVGVSSGTGNGTLTLRVDENATEDQRSFQVTVTPSEGEEQTLGFVQSGAAPPAQPSRPRLTSSSYVVRAVGTTITANVTAGADVEWSASVSGDFAHLVGVSSGTGNGTLSISVDTNPDQERRSFQVTLTPQTGDPQTVSYVQDGTAPAVLSVTASDRSVLYTGGTVRIDIENTGSARLNWTVSVEEDWASISGAAGGVNDGHAIVVVDENDANRRSLVVTISAEGASGSPQTITITQDAAPEQPQSAAQVTAAKYFVSSVGEVITVTVDVAGSGSLAWQVELPAETTTCTVVIERTTTEGEEGMEETTTERVEETRDRGDWVRILGTARGTGDGSFQLQVDANDGECSGARFGFSATVQFPDAPELNQTLYFSQDRATDSDEDPRLWVSTLNVSASGETVDVHLTIADADVRWKAKLEEGSAEPTWARFVGAVTVDGDINGTGSTVVQIQVDSNTTNASRAIDLTIEVDEDGDGTYDALDPVTLTQAAAISSLSVADTRGTEDSGSLVFRVTLSPPSSSTVTVLYATSDGTAIAPADYTDTSGTLEFTAGTVFLEVRVPVIDDSIDDNGETFTLTLSNPSGVGIEDGDATGTITNSDPIPQAWLARFGRTAASHVADGIQARLEGRYGALSASQRRGNPELRTRRFFNGAAQTGRLPSEYGQRSLAPGFHFPGSLFFSSAERSDSPVERISAWARASATEFAGAEGDLSIDGSVHTALAGVDAERGRWLAGLALAHTTGEGGYGHPGVRGAQITSNLTGLHPYARFSANAKTSLWAALGYGTGSMAVTPDGSKEIETGIRHTMAAVGGRGVLSVRTADIGVFELALRSDAVVSRTVSAEAGGMIATTGDAGRLRALLEGTGSFQLGRFGVIEPSVTVGVRHDAGDAETGTGIEIGGGIAYRAGGFHLDLSARSLQAHRDAAYRERGYSASVSYLPEQGGTGLTMSLGSFWGHPGGSFGTLWDKQVAPLEDSYLPRQQRTQLLVGYGLPEHSNGTWMPYVGFTSGEQSRDARFGFRLDTHGWSHANLQIGLRKQHGSKVRPMISLRWNMAL